MAAERRASVTWNGDLMSGSGTIDEVGSGAFGPLDVSWAARSEEASGGKTSPEELIAAAHASCFSMALASGLAKAGTAPERLQTSAVRDLRARNGDHEDRARGSRRPCPGSTPTASARRPRTRRRTARSRRRSPACPRSRSTHSSTPKGRAPAPFAARVGIVVDPLPDDARALAPVEPVRVLEALVRPDLEPVVAAAARLPGDSTRGAPEPRASPHARGGQHVEPLERTALGEPRQSRAIRPSSLGDEERRIRGFDDHAGPAW